MNRLRTCRNVLPLVVASLLVLSSCAQIPSADPREFVSSSGLRVTPPPGWEVASEEMVAGAAAEARRLLSTLRSGPGRPSVGAIVFDPSSSGFVSNITVTVVDQRLDVSPESLSSFKRELVRQAASGGAEMSILKAGLGVRETGGSYFSVVQRTRYPELGKDLRQWMVAIPAGSRTLHVTATALDSEFDRLEPLFEEAIHRVRYETPLTEQWRHLPALSKAAFVLVAAIAVSAVFALRTWLRRARRPA